MKDWNIVVTARDEGFDRTCDVLGRMGPLSRTEYMNLMVMKIHDVEQFVNRLTEMFSKDPGILKYDIARIVPLQHTFAFQSADEFESRAKEIVLGWLEKLAGKSFHIRMHRRGFKGKIHAQNEESMLGDLLLDALKEAGTPGSVSFKDPDAIIDIETVSHRAGISIWMREDLERYAFLHLD